VPLRHYDAGDTRVVSLMVELRRHASPAPGYAVDPLPSGCADALAALVDAATAHSF
jgi:hypothetical protein